MTELLKNPSAFEAALENAFTARSNANETAEAAFDRFAAQRLPNRRIEGWKWSDFNAALRASAPDGAGTAKAIAPSPFAALNPIEIQIVNGRINAPMDDQPKGLRFGVMEAMGTIPELEIHPIVSLNVAMTAKSFGLEVKEGVALDRPILIRHIDEGGGLSFGQTMLRIGVGAAATVIETYEGAGAALASHVCHMVVRDRGRFNRLVLSDTGAGAVNHAIVAAKLEAGSVYEQTSLSTGAKLSRHETLLHFWGEDGEARVDSAALLTGEAHADFTTHVLHKKPGCAVRQLHKGVAADRGRAVFQGKFEVERAAQKTDAQMTANALLLSDRAEANHKPELEIYADDVECAHGSTCGALDDAALFYLRQRGLSERQARALLIEAFAGEVVDGIEEEKLRAVFAARVAAWLEDQS
ncbi:MAG: Fe-S cluster assembly protein SufD [Pseudomonadota bacterium]